MGVTLVVQLVAGAAVTPARAPVLGLWLVALGGPAWAGWAALVLALVLGRGLRAGRGCGWAPGSTTAGRPTC